MNHPGFMVCSLDGKALYILPAGKPATEGFVPESNVKAWDSIRTFVMEALK